MHINNQILRNKDLWTNLQAPYMINHYHLFEEDGPKVGGGGSVRGEVNTAGLAEHPYKFLEL